MVHRDAKPEVTSKDLSIIGWREYVSLPEWGIDRIKAKADSGARSSAIDVADIRELEGDRVRFDVVTSRTDADSRRTVEATVVRRTRVKSSFGHPHDRIFVSARIQLGDRVIDCELGLVSRPKMLCRMLIGRKTLARRFLVDPGRTYIVSRRKRAATKKKGRRT